MYPAVQSSEGRLGVTRSLSRQESDVTDHPVFCNSGWGGTEDYRGQRTYSPCVSQSQVNPTCVFVCEFVVCPPPRVSLLSVVGYMRVWCVTAPHVVQERQC